MKTGKAFWRTLDELADDPSFVERLHNEFPSQVEAITDPTTRRTFMKLMGASLALAGVTACTTQPDEAIVPYVKQPEDLVPGKPMFYATAVTLGGVATGILVESHEGRPTKIEGNPQHPSSLGAADVFAQAEILNIYDPDRAQALTNTGEVSSWSQYIVAIKAALNAQVPLQGAGVRILSDTVSSPTLGAQIREFLGRFPSARWHQWDPAGRNNVRLGSKLAFGEFVDAQYSIDKADVILALDADFLASGPGSLAHARQFASRRRPEEIARMNRLYVAETMPTSTGSRADHRLALKPSEIVALARQIAAGVGVGSAGAASAETQKWVTAVAQDLQAHKGTSLVIAGDAQPPVVHALAHAMNQALGNVGQTVVYTQTAEAEPVDQVESIKALVADMDAGKVDLLIVLGGNPVYNAPADLNFGKALERVQTRVYLAQFNDETAELCHWQIPAAHFLESWSDARGHDGTATIVQPLIAPLYNGRTAHEVIAVLSDRPERQPYELVREYWSQARPAADFDREWRRWLHDGIIPDTAFAAKTVTLTADAAAAPAGEAGGGLEISFRADPAVFDGRFANNAWLQELPKPITKLVWDNAVITSQATADRIKAENTVSSRGGEHGTIESDVVEIKYKGRSITGPIFAVAGHPNDCVTVHLGYGRTRAGHIGNGPGFNAYALRTSDGLWSGAGAEVATTGDSYPLACTQYHHLMEGRGMVRAVTKDEFEKDPKSVHEGFEAPARTITLYPDFKYEGYKWGMSIDVNACIGCNACVVACHAENNIAVVGKDQVMRGREMHWLRVDAYYAGDNPNAADLETYFQPVPCMQCENAPCEVVCPVGATVHSHEGLNDMVYNRCVGTRYCSNNCPYKVRRFNYLLYSDWNTESYKLGRNPDVTVRSRGVMEKCTYCVQRITVAKIESEKGNRKIADGEVKTACQQTCPTDAIVFGDLNDPNSRVAQLQAQERNYSLLADLNTRPRTQYLAAVRNVNPELSA
ncbi:MAG TPA: TAT-variant-translocated molybdopterin oxidoreductase [Vicinamibacterales bacterium]|nr:TAT-variant-translocated molybdopterin oxidoreductase [Vicinamibacterales bacterium]